MKIEFLQAKYGIDFKLPEDFLSVLSKVMSKSEKKGKKVAVFCAVQFLPKLNEVMDFINKSGFEAVTSKLDRATFKGQILGCDSYASNLNLDLKDVGCFVYIGDGMFHPNALLLAQEHEDEFCDVVVVNAVESNCEVISKDEVDKIFKKRRGNLMKFHTSKVIGVFVSSKWGQEFKDSALKLRDMYKDKEFYYFVGDNFLEYEMENFPFVECWVNTACPRIGQDDVLRQTKAVVNIKDVYLSN